MTITGAFTFSVAGIGFRIRAPRAALDVIEALHGAFPKPQGEGDIHWTLSWNETACHYQDGAAPIRIPSPRFISSCTSVLIGYLLRKSLPSMLFFHGNALQRKEKSPVLLMGESGSGKTTLADCLSAQFPDVYTIAAEDFLIVDPTKRQLHPYPRAASIRRESSIPERAEKTLSQRSAKVLAPLPLAEAEIFLLCRDFQKNNAVRVVDEDFTVWVTSIPKDLPQLFSNLNLPCPALDYGYDFPALVLRKPLDFSGLAALREELFKEGAMPMAASPASPGATPRVLPMKPVGTAIESTAAIPRLLENAVNFGAGETPPGAMFFNVARAFADAHCHIFNPGGSPAHSATLIHKLANGETPG